MTPKITFSPCAIKTLTAEIDRGNYLWMGLMSIKESKFALHVCKIAIIVDSNETFIQMDSSDLLTEEGIEIVEYSINNDLEVGVIKGINGPIIGAVSLDLEMPTLIHTKKEMKYYKSQKVNSIKDLKAFINQPH